MSPYATSTDNLTARLEQAEALALLAKTTWVNNRCCSVQYFPPHFRHRWRLHVIRCRSCNKSVWEIVPRPLSLITSSQAFSCDLWKGQGNTEVWCQPADVMHLICYRWFSGRDMKVNKWKSKLVMMMYVLYNQTEVGFRKEAEWNWIFPSDLTLLQDILNKQPDTSVSLDVYLVTPTTPSKWCNVRNYIC